MVVVGDGSGGVVVRGDGGERGIGQCRHLSSLGRARNAPTSRPEEIYFLLSYSTASFCFNVPFVPKI